MKKEEVEPYVRKMLREEFSLPLKENADLRITDPIRYEELCRKGIDWMANEVQKDEALFTLCRIASLDFTGLIEEEKQQAQKQIHVTIN